MNVQIVFAFLKCEYLESRDSYEKEINYRYEENDHDLLKFGAKIFAHQRVTTKMTCISPMGESDQSYVESTTVLSSVILWKV